jgi:hypothetical protein
MEKWEYKIVKVEAKTKAGGWSNKIKTELPSDLEEVFNELGDEGWELVAIFTPIMVGRSEDFFCFFRKRVE